MKQKVALGPVEFANMKRFGMDPSNPEHVREYALSLRPGRQVTYKKSESVRALGMIFHRARIIG